MAEFILSVIWNSLGMDFISLCYFRNLSCVAMWYANSSVYGWLEMLHLKNQIQLNQLITKVRDQHSAHPLPCCFAEESKLSKHIVSQPINKIFCPKKTAGPRKRSQVIKYSLESLNSWAQFLPFPIFYMLWDKCSPTCVLFLHLLIRWKQNQGVVWVNSLVSKRSEASWVCCCGLAKYQLAVGRILMELRC